MTNKTKRNDKIIALHQKGMNIGKLGRRFRISRQRVSKILKRWGCGKLA